MEQPHKVKKVGDSHDLRLDPRFVRANKLKDGDYIVVDLSKFRIIRAEDFAMFSRAPVLEKTE
jgi:hypothetical protein